MRIIQPNAYIGVYNSVKELTEDLLKRKIHQSIGDNDKKQDHINDTIKINVNTASDFKNDKKAIWKERECL